MNLFMPGLYVPHNVSYDQVMFILTKIGIFQHYFSLFLVYLIFVHQLRYAY